MNFLAHFVLATRYGTPPRPRPAYVLGNALPDLLPLADTRRRFRPATLETVPAETPEDAALRGGLLIHLATDAAFHKTASFARAQAAIKSLLREGNFTDIHLRPFFLAHVLAELALDAALLRAEPGLADAFYHAFTAADFAHAAHWTEEALQTPLPALPGVLTRFARSRYLDSYRQDAGVSEGLSRLCARVHLDTFEGTNFVRLTAVVAAAAERMASFAPALLAETAAAVRTPQ